MSDTAVAATQQETEQLPDALGARRIAVLLAERTELPVTGDDIQRLVADGYLVAKDEYKGWPIYLTADALAIDAGPLRGIVDKRVAWMQASLTRDQAAERIGWPWRDIDRMGREGRITVGALDRYLIEDLDRLAAEADGEQYITAQAAADLLEIRPADWKYVEAAGWAPTSRRRPHRPALALQQPDQLRPAQRLPRLPTRAHPGVLESTASARTRHPSRSSRSRPPARHTTRHPNNRAVATT